MLQLLDILTGDDDLFIETPIEIYQNLILAFGADIAANAYRMAAEETRHFTSYGWRHAFNQGMENFSSSSSFPYGWKEMEDYWNQCPDYAPSGTVDMKEAGTGATISYLQWDTPEGSMYSIGQWLSINNNDPSKWNPGQSDYVTRVNSIKLPTA